MPGRKELRLVELELRNLKEITRGKYELLLVWAPPESLEHQPEQKKTK